MSERGKLIGEVVWFSSEKGYGFIRDSGGKDIFVHHTAIKMDGFRSLREGQRVEFFLVDGRKGKQALDVMILGGGTA